MARSSEFFAAKNPQAVLKHGVLTRYAHYFAGRAGKAAGGRVAFIDGYAGAGRYADGSPGSPLLLATQAERVKFIDRNVRLAFVETNRTYRDKLKVSLQEHNAQADVIDDRRFELAAPALLDRYDDAAVLAFVDPFGLAVSYECLLGMLRRSSRRQPVDVLYHFSLSTVARMGSAGVSSDPADRANNAPQLDAALGEVDWRTPFEATPDNLGAATETAILVATLFADQVRAATGMRVTGIEVRQRPGQLPKYLLMLFSGDPSGDAHWEFAGNAAKAHVEWLLHCDHADYNAEMAALDAGGTLLLFEMERPTLEDIERKVTVKNNETMHRHLGELFKSHRSLTPVNDIAAIFGDLLGQAGPPAVRQAIKRLNAAGLVDDDGIGDFHRRLIRWTGP